MRGRFYQLFFVGFCALLGVLSSTYAAWSPKNLKSELSFRSSQLAQDVGQEGGNQYRTSVDIEYHEGELGSLEKDLRVSAEVNDLGLFMISVQQASLYRKHFRSELEVGRFVLQWSDVDSTWGFGKLNNRKNFEFFRPGQEGLTGARYGHRWLNGLGVEVFGSLIYVPEMNPALDINAEDNTIESRHPWSKAPPSETSIAVGGIEQTLPVKYYINYPDIAEIALRYSIGGRFSYKTEQIDIGAFYMKKPENQLSIGAGASFRPSPANGEQDIRVNIQPEVFYHDVYGGDAKFKYKNTIFTASIIAVDPNSFPDGEEFISRNLDLKTEKIVERYAGFGVQRSNQFISFGFNYVARISEFDQEADFLAQNPRWNQAVNAFLGLRFSRYLRLYADLKYDTLTFDRLAYLDLEYLVDKNWSLMGGVEMIGTPDSEETFWSDFRNNDSIYAGMKYVF